MVLSFTSLHDGDESVSAKFPTWKEDMFVVFDSFKFSVFKSYIQFFAFLNTAKDKTFHEVIPGSKSQRLKFDIDADEAKLHGFDFIEFITRRAKAQGEEITRMPEKIDNKAKFEYIINFIIDVIVSEFLSDFSKCIVADEIIMCESHGEGKFSAHLILPFAVSSHMQAAVFTSHVANSLPSEIVQFLDLNVNKSTQFFRIVGCHKKGSSRVKTICGRQQGFITKEDTIIGNTANIELLPDLVAAKTAKKAPEANVSDDVIDAVNKLADTAGISKHSKFFRSKGNLFYYKRFAPSWCEFCSREHTNDNTVYIKIVGTDAYYCCFRSKKNRNIGSVAGLDTKNEKSTMGQAHIDNIIAKNADVRSKSPFDAMKNVNRYNRPALDPFETNVEVLVVHAPMKMGKTKALQNYIGQTCTENSVIRFVSFRRTFSSMLKSKFPDAILYNEVQGELVQKQVIVQVESLHRIAVYAGIEPPDLLVLDECESICAQLCSGLSSRFVECWAKFRWLVANSKRVVCMDANMSARTFAMLESLRPDFLAKGLYHVNEYKNATADTYYTTDNDDAWTYLLDKSIAAGEPVAIVISSLVDAKAIALHIEKKHKIIANLYSGETSQNVKHQHYSDVDTHWSSAQVLIYTPTVSAGISFERQHFKKVFGFFTDMSCPAETCMQMLGRIRDVQHHEYYIYFKVNRPPKIMSITKSDVERDICEARNFDGYDVSGVVGMQYTKDGLCQIYKTDYFPLWVENTVITNLSKCRFFERFVGLMSSAGAKIIALTDEIFLAICGVVISDAAGSSYLAQKSNVVRTTCEKIADAPELTAAEIADIRERSEIDADISEEEMYAFKKASLRKFYGFGDPIDVKFVETYAREPVKYAFRNLRIAHAKNSAELLACIENLKARSYEIHKRFMGNVELQSRDLQWRYSHATHANIIACVQKCGWESLMDEKLISEAEINNKVDDFEPLWIMLIAAARSENIPVAKISDPEHKTDNFIKELSKVCIRFYMVAIIETKKKSKIYTLERKWKFGGIGEPSFDGIWEPPKC